MVWTDTHVPVLLGEMGYYGAYFENNAVPSPTCHCWNLNQACERAGRLDCPTLYFACNTAH
jgi:hypothetical protein